MGQIFEKWERETLMFRPILTCMGKYYLSVDYYCLKLHKTYFYRRLTIAFLHTWYLSITRCQLHLSWTLETSPLGDMWTLLCIARAKVCKHTISITCNQSCVKLY